MVETVVNLKDPADWPERLTQEQLIAKMDRELRFTGLVNSWTMPIKNRTDMLSTGIRTTLGVKVFGPDLVTIQAVGAEIEALLAPVEGTASIFAERSFGGRYLDIRPDRKALARYGLGVGDLQDGVATALGGRNVTMTVEGRERYPVQVRYARELRDDPARLSQVLVATPAGPQVPLTQLAEVSFSAGAPVIKSENGQLVGMVFIDVRDRDVGSYVAEARRLVDEQLVLPAGYRLEWSGQYEAMERVKARLMVMVPVTLGIIALLLYFNFLNMVEVGIVMFSLPFALVGGVWLMWLLDYDFSVAVAVGFIALGGLAAQTGVVMLLYLDQAWRQATASGPVGIEGLMAAISRRSGGAGSTQAHDRRRHRCRTASPHVGSRGRSVRHTEDRRPDDRGDDHLDGAHVGGNSGAVLSVAEEGGDDVGCARRQSLSRFDHRTPASCLWRWCTIEAFQRLAQG